MLKRLNYIYVVLILEKNLGMKDFRSICFYDVVYKLILKFFVNLMRISKVLFFLRNFIINYIFVVFKVFYLKLKSY